MFIHTCLLSNAILYIENPSKTDGQLLVSGYNVEPQTAALDFEITAMMAHKMRHISCKKTSNLAYHLIQSFSPTEKITPREAHDLGRKLALEFTEGKYEFVIATHIDKGHIHNHIIINAVSFYDYKKLRTVPFRTAQQIRSISDRLCMEAQLSIIKDPQQLGQLYPTYVQKKCTTSNRTEVRKKLNFCLERATNYAQFLQMAQELGISVGSVHHLSNFTDIVIRQHHGTPSKAFAVLSAIDPQLLGKHISPALLQPIGKGQAGQSLELVAPKSHHALPEVLLAGILLQRNHSSVVALPLCSGADIGSVSVLRKVHAFLIRQIRGHRRAGQLQGRHGGGDSSRITLCASKRTERPLDEFCRVRLVDPGCDEQLPNLDRVEGQGLRNGL